MAILGAMTIVTTGAGKVGGIHLRRSKHGLVLSKNPPHIRFRTAANTLAAYSFGGGAKIAGSLSPADKETWYVWCGSITKVQPVSGVSYNPDPIDAQTGLAVGYAIANGGTLDGFPHIAPVTPFAPTEVVLTAVTSIGGGILFTAGSGNDAGSKTIMRAQLLPRQAYRPSRARYRITEVTAFSGGGDTVIATRGLVSGRWYALAYNQVQTTDGQQIPWLEIDDPVQAG